MWDGMKQIINWAIEGLNKLIDTLNKIPLVNIPNVPSLDTAGVGAAALGARGGPRAAPAPVTITINAGLGTDPAAVAREIRRALAADAYRTGWNA
jgi:hypothetical protein